MLRWFILTSCSALDQRKAVRPLPPSILLDGAPEDHAPDIQQNQWQATNIALLQAVW